MSRKKNHKKIILIVLDGWGVSRSKRGNAIEIGKTVNYHTFLKEYPHCELLASGESVGLPKNTQGGSEVGHLHIGAGRIVWQPLKRIDRAIKDGSFFRGNEFLNAIKNCRKHNSRLHLMGLFSDGKVHSSLDHLTALLLLAKKHNVKTFVHAFLDGRDVPEKSSANYFRFFYRKTRELKSDAKIATIIGRYYAMDRDNNWIRTKKAYELLVEGKGYDARNPFEAVSAAYERGEKTDYYVKPTAVDSEGFIKNNDSVIFFNFRTDRARQLTRAFIEKDFKKFRTKKLRIFYVGMEKYEPSSRQRAAFSEPFVRNNLAILLAKNKIRQLRIAETEKYAHITYFFNSQVERPNAQEDRILVKSPKVPSYDLKPEMSAYEIVKKLIPEIRKQKYGFVLANFANPDLVGHSGNLKAAVKAVEIVDECIGKIVDESGRNGYIVIITGDHGNAEQMLYPDGSPCPSHTTNKVPFILIYANKPKLRKKLKLRNGRLIDIAPTILELLGIRKPREMTGMSLFAS